jgi:hypothetical protein
MYGNYFGSDTTPLTNGLVLRHWDGTDYTIFNWKTNDDIAQVCYDVGYDQGTVQPTGKHTLRARITFNAKDKHGTTIELEAGEKLQFIVQDNLGGGNNDFVRCMAQGHYHAHSL